MLTAHPFLLEAELIKWYNALYCKKRRVRDLDEKSKKIISMIVGKLLVFAFCVIFITTYNKLFGVDNSIVGVMMLMSLLMFMKADFGINSTTVGILMTVIFTSMGVLASVSNYNMFIGIIINFITISIVLVLTKGDETQNNYMPFIMAYIMFKGYDIEGILLDKRILSLFIIGTLIGALYYLINQNKETTTSFKKIIYEATNSVSWRRWALVFITTMTISMGFGDAFNVEKSMWIDLTVLSLIQPIEDEIIKRRKKRIPATIVGSMIMFILFTYVIPEEKVTALMLIAGFLSMFINSYFIKTAYNSFSALVTAMLVMPAGEAVALRIACNIIGASLTIIILFVFEKYFEYKDEKIGQLN